MNNALENHKLLKYEEFEDYEIKENFQIIPELMDSLSQFMNLSELLLPSSLTMPEMMSDKNITFTPLNIWEENLLKNLLSILPAWSEFPTSGVPNRWNVTYHSMQVQEPKTTELKNTKTNVPGGKSIIFDV